MVTMTRSEQAGSNLLSPGIQPWRYFERAYPALGPAEWISLPDAAFPVSVVVSFPGISGGAANLEATSSTMDTIVNMGSVNPLAPFSPIVYQISTDTIIATTTFLVQGHTAIRLNIVGGTVAISVRC